MSDESIFAAALAISNLARRSEYLEQACGGNPNLRHDVDGLLAAHAADNPLDRPGAGGPLLAATCLTDSNLTGTTIAGRYKLLEQIGDGGMGTVWMAEQRAPVKRLVAVKLIKPGMDSKGVLARFEAERQALAMMDHPNIAKVLDAGTGDDGRPFFVMELVKGLPLTEYCDARRLPVNDRLDLFIQICSAVQHAHQKAVIHRDLKPSNVLVTEHDGKPVPKVIDFGLAKALGTTNVLTDRTLHTAYGTVVGTPLYMAPEQVGINALDVDTRTDIYALGVILYELLTGTTPLEKARFKQAAWEEVKRLIRDEEPPRPSTRLSSDKTLPSLAASRQVEPAQLRRLVRGDLDWIVMKALEKDRSRRYDTANGLAKDVQRYQKGDAVEACPPTLGYRLKKLYHKHRGAVLTAGAFAAMLLVATGVSLTFGMMARQSEKRAAASAEEVIKSREQLARTEYAGWLLPRVEYGLSMQKVDRLLREHKGAGVREILDGTQADLRNWEWHYLNRLSQSGFRFDLHGRYKYVYSAAFSPNGKQIVITSRDRGQAVTALDILAQPGSVQVCDAENGKVQFTLGEGLPGLWGARFHPKDGGQILTVQYGAVRVWDVANRKEVFSLFPEEGLSFSNAVFSAGGTRIATSWTILGSQWEKERNPVSIRIWDVKTQQQIQSLKGSYKVVHTVAFSPDGEWVIACVQPNESKDPYERNIKIWDSETGEELLSVPRLQNEDVFSVSFSPDGSRFVANYTGGNVRIWGVKKDGRKPVLGGDPIILRGHTADARSAVFSRDGKRVVTASSDGTARIWDAATGAELQALNGHTLTLRSAAFNHDGTRVVIVGVQAPAKVWDVRDGSVENVGFRHDDEINSASFSPSGDRVMTSSRAVTKIWNAHTRERLFELAGSESSPRFSPDGRWIVTLQGRAATIRNANDGAEVRQLQAHTDGLYDASFSKDGSQLLVCHNDWTVTVWDVEKGMEMYRLGKPVPNDSSGGFTIACFNPEGTRILVENLSNSGSITVHDARTGKQTQALDVKPSAGMATSGGSFSPDGKRYMTKMYGNDPVENGFRVWDVASGREVFRFRTPADYKFSLNFSSVTNRIITGNNEQTAKVWDPETGLELITLQADGRVWSASFSADGTKLLLAGGNEARIYDGTPLPESKK